MRQLITNPLYWFVFILAFLTIRNNSEDGHLHKVIRSDGRGYYAYLPAIFIYNDPTFENSKAAEASYESEGFNPEYLFKTESGSTYNKYSPGIAVLQSPFFGMACFISWLADYPVDGYSPPFEWAFLVGSLFYSLLGLFLFVRLLDSFFPDQHKRVRWIIPGIYAGTTLLMYSTNSLGFTHHYSFTLFTAFSLLILKTRESFSAKNVLLTGVILGLIFLVRPTNILILLSIPFLLKSKENTLSFFKSLFSSLHLLLIGTIGFTIVTFLLLATWKWESGQWILWSYSGEGFNFLRPAFWENILSFRIGLFIHSPLLICSIIGSLILYRRNKFQAIWWWIYFLMNAWVISSWWCWDYESTFGNRPFTEHLVILILPFFLLMENWRTLSIAIISILSFVGIIRYETYFTGYMNDQRFTAKNYIPSLAFWKETNFNRWQFQQSTPPFGQQSNNSILAEQKPTFKFDAETEFGLTGAIGIPNSIGNQRIYYTISLEKQSKEPLDEVFAVIHATSYDKKKNHYVAIPLYNDRLDGIESWEEVTFSGLIPNNQKQFDEVAIYIWNKSKQSFEVRNYQSTISLYKAD